MRSNKASISFKLRVYMIDQNINIKAKENIMFSIAWFSKLRLNGTFIHLNKIANARISYNDVQSLSEKKSRKSIKRKKNCAFKKQWQNHIHIVIIFYHTFLSLSMWYMRSHLHMPAHKPLVWCVSKIEGTASLYSQTCI